MWRRRVFVGFAFSTLTACAVGPVSKMPDLIVSDVVDSQVATIAVPWWSPGSSAGCLSCVNRLERAQDGTVVYDFERDGLAKSIRMVAGSYRVLYGYNVHGKFYGPLRLRRLTLR
jgi:hypothetical protein